MDEAVRKLRPDHALEAAGYVRVSLRRQADGHSPEVQRQAIERLAKQEGYVLAMVEEDHERGSKVTRAGYQRIIESVRAGTTHAVIVFMFDRWGRDGAEWLTRAREFERLGVPIISVQEGKDEGGLMRFMRAGMAEEYSRQLAKRVRPNKEESARKGIHQGRTPLGYRRVYPPAVDARRRPPAELVPDPEYAPIVQMIFRRYAEGGWSHRRIVDSLNQDPSIPPPPPLRYRDSVTGEMVSEARGWACTVIRDVLRNPVYCGLIRYNRRPSGDYERAQPGDEFIAEGRHQPLIDRALFDQVANRLAAAYAKPGFNRNDAVLGTSLFRCTACGGPMLASHQDGGILYRCAWYQRRKSTDGGPHAALSYAGNPAHAALLREVRRLRGAPWTPQAERRLAGGKAQDRVGHLQRALAVEESNLMKHARLTAQLGELTAEEIVAFRTVSREISDRIAVIKQELATMDQRAMRIPSLRNLHERLSRTEIRDVTDALAARGDDAGLRELMLALVASVRIVERVPHRQPRWLRADVTWTEDVATLLDAGVLTLDPPEPTPAHPTPTERHRARQRRYRAQRRGHL